MWCFPEHGCGDLVRLRCMRVRAVPIPSASLPIFYLQTRRSEIFGELTMRTVSHSTILNRFVEWLLQTWYKVIWVRKEANILDAISYSEKMHMDSASYRSGIFPKEKLWPPTICRTNHWADLSLPRKDTTTLFKQAAIMRDDGSDIEVASEDSCYCRKYWKCSEIGIRVAKVLPFDLD